MYIKDSFQNVQFKLLTLIQFTSEGSSLAN